MRLPLNFSLHNDQQDSILYLPDGAQKLFFELTNQSPDHPIKLPAKKNILDKSAILAAFPDNGDVIWERMGEKNWIKIDEEGDRATLFIFDESERELLGDDLPPLADINRVVSESARAEVSAKNFHFQFLFRPRVLRQIDTIHLAKGVSSDNGVVAGSEADTAMKEGVNWEVSVDTLNPFNVEGEGTFVILSLLRVDAGEIPPGQGLSLLIDGLIPDAKLGTRASRVEVRHDVVVGLPDGVATAPLQGTLMHHLNLINESRKFFEIAQQVGAVSESTAGPFSATLIGSNTLVNDGLSSEVLRLRVKADQDVNVGILDEPSQFHVEWDEVPTDGLHGLVTTRDGEITMEMTDAFSFWTAAEKRVQWGGNGDPVWKKDQSYDVTLTIPKSTAPSGYATIRIAWTHFPDFKDGRLVLLVNVGPMFIEEAAGNTPRPTSQGTALPLNLVQKAPLQLFRTNFRAAVGSSSNPNGKLAFVSSQEELALLNKDAGKGMRFGTNNGEFTFWSNPVLAEGNIDSLMSQVKSETINSAKLILHFEHIEVVGRTGSIEIGPRNPEFDQAVADTRDAQSQILAEADRRPISIVILLQKIDDYKTKLAEVKTLALATGGEAKIDFTNPLNTLNKDEGERGLENLEALEPELPKAVSLMSIQANGQTFIGTGFTDPDPALTVVGDISVLGTVNKTGTNNFRISHPTNNHQELVHACIEGPEAGVYYRGTGQLEDGRAIVDLPSYFEALARPEGRTVILTAVGETPYLLSHNPVEAGQFEVFGSLANGKFSWEVKAIRADVPELQVEVPKRIPSHGASIDTKLLEVPLGQ